MLRISSPARESFRFIRRSANFLSYTDRVHRRSLCSHTRIGGWATSDKPKHSIVLCRLKSSSTIGVPIYSLSLRSLREASWGITYFAPPAALLKYEQTSWLKQSWVLWALGQWIYFQCLYWVWLTIRCQRRYQHIPHRSCFQINKHNRG